MPAKNSIKQYIENGYYHLYNRGVEKRSIFEDEQDYVVFLSYLKTYLLPKDVKKLQGILVNPESHWREKDRALKLLRLNNFSDAITLLAHCLMPNHFHFLVRQKDADSIDRFVSSFFTRYSMYFNRKYRRVGPLFQGIYKAVLVETDEQLLYLTRYIHRNPEPLTSLASQGTTLRSYTYSSYLDYLAVRQTEWVRPQEILANFGQSGFNSYENFVEDIANEERSLPLLKDLVLD